MIKFVHKIVTQNWIHYKLDHTVWSIRYILKNPWKRAMKISWFLVLLHYATIIESKAKPRLDQTSEFTTFFLKKWHKLVKNEKLNNWDEQRTGQICHISYFTLMFLTNVTNRKFSRQSLYDRSNYWVGCNHMEQLQVVLVWNEILSQLCSTNNILSSAWKLYCI